MNPDQTALHLLKPRVQSLLRSLRTRKERCGPTEQSNLGSYCLQTRLPKMRKQPTFVMNGAFRVNSGNPYTASVFCPENVCFFMPVAYIRVDFRLNFFMKANNIH